MSAFVKNNPGAEKEKRNSAVNFGGGCRAATTPPASERVERMADAAFMAQSVARLNAAPLAAAR
jgi:hypothetical protein